MSGLINVKVQNYTSNGTTTEFLETITSIPGLSNSFMINPGSSMGYTSNFSSFDISSEGDYQFVVSLPIHISGDAQIVDPYDTQLDGPPEGCDNSDPNNEWRCRGYGAAVCCLYPCVRTYEAAVSNGALTERVIAETPETPSPFDWDPSAGWQYATVNASCLSNDEAQRLSQMGYNVQNSQSMWIPYRMSTIPDSTDPTNNNGTTDHSPIQQLEAAIQKRGCLYAMDVIFTQSLNMNYLSEIWPGVLVGQWNVDGGGVADFQAPQILQTLYNFGQYSFPRTQSLFANIADSLTSYMRNNPGNSGNASTDPYNMTVPALR